jgi:hypothetical protein
LRVVGEDGVKDPRKTQHGIEDHDHIVHPAALEGQNVTEHKVARVNLEEREIHKQIPDRCIHTVDGGKGNKEGQVAVRLLDAVDTQHHVAHDGHGVFAAVDQVWEDVAGIAVPANTLK